MDDALMGSTEIGSLLGVSRQRAAQLAAEYDDFPAPVATLAAGRIWKRADIEAWIAAHPDRPTGRPRRPEQ